MPDDEIIRKTVSDADRIGLFQSGQLREAKVIRLGECMPVYDLDYEDKMIEAFNDVHKIRNLYSIGRLGGYYFCMSPAAVNQGIKMAKHILDNKSKC
jgi:protoporphyrinogen oxidase